MDTFSNNLLGKGLFPRTTIPLLSSAEFALCISGEDPSRRGGTFPKASEPVVHSAPKDTYTRRTYSIPNPAGYVELCLAVGDDWSEIKKALATSSISCSRTLEAPPLDARAITYFDQDEFLRRRIMLGAGKTWYVKTDISGFYPSIYLHSLEWVMSGARVGPGVRQNNIGSKLDNISRKLQDHRSIGLQIGPDISAILSEMVATYLDRAMQTSYSIVRHVDDIYIYTESRDKAEQAVATLTRSCKDLMLNLNGQKTRIGEMVDEYNSTWRNELALHSGSLQSAKSPVRYFDVAFQLAKKYPNESILRYAIKSSVDSITGTLSTSEISLSLILSALTVDSRAIDLIAALIVKADTITAFVDRERIRDYFLSFINRHAGVRNGFEVAWAIWLLASLDLIQPNSFPDFISAAILDMDDDICAATLLLLQEHGLVNVGGPRDWDIVLSDRDACNQKHWLVAYEAKLRGWFGATFTGDEPALMFKCGGFGISFLKDEVVTKKQITWVDRLLQRSRSITTSPEGIDEGSDFLLEAYD